MGGGAFEMSGELQPSGARISIVVPVYNERESLSQLHAELAGAAASAAPSGPWEFIFVDDGSRDGTWEALVEIQRRDRRVRAIRLKCNFGQTPAMACGIDAARGELVVTMDGDLQNDPADIPRLLATLDEGYDVVCGWRYRRQDALSRTIPSKIANRLIGWLTGVRLHDYGCSLKAYRADAIKRTPLYADLHRFIPAMATLTGASIAELKVNHRARSHGRTKYTTFARTWRVALDMLTVALLIKFAQRPLRFFGLLALGVVAATAAGLLQVWRSYLGPVGFIPQVWTGVVLLAIWLAGHLVVVGWVAELCLATSHAGPARAIAPGGN
jgi:glycosyltransferase involved in cell wall biosynthesis